MKCLQCGSEDIVKNLRVVDRGNGNVRGDLNIEVESVPDAIFFKGIRKAALRANVCAECGSVTLNVAKHDAEMLKNAK